MNLYTLPYHLIENDVKTIVSKNKNHFDETFGDIRIDWDYFNYLSREKKAFVCILYDEKTVGIAGFILNDNANQNLTEAENVVLFIEKEYRAKYTKKLLDFCKEEMKTLKADKVVFTLKSEKLGRYLRINKFKPEYTVWEYAL